MKKFVLIMYLLGWSILAFAQQNMTLLDQLEYEQRLSDVWGYTDSDGNEYTLVGTRTGVSIVDVTDPADVQELFFISGPNSVWRDIKTWGDYAYVTNEKGEGILIIDLSGLPGTVAHERCGNFTAHNLFIDEDGFMYIFGANVGKGGALIADLNLTPYSPELVGLYDEAYIHDGYVRGDTLWAAEIYAGHFAVIDVSVKDAPVVLAQRKTPHRFTHNVWLSDDGNYLFTTDERTNAYVAAYNVSQLDNIEEMDRYQSSPGTGVIPHNTHYLGGYLITAYYRDGVTITDVQYPDNMIEVGNYDTSPLSGSGFDGSWGTYPFFPSGTVLASDIGEGLFVLDAVYQRACYLEGSVTDSATGKPVPGVTVEILGTSNETTTGLDGAYKTGTADSGTYDVRFSGAECVTKTVTDVNLDNDVITLLHDTLKDCDVQCLPAGGSEDGQAARHDDPSNPLHDLQGRPAARTGIYATGLSLCEVTHTATRPASDIFSLQATPMPFDNYTTLEYRAPAQGARLLVHDSQGRILHREVLTENSGMLRLGSRWLAGVYFVHLQYENHRITKKLIKLVRE